MRISGFLYQLGCENQQDADSVEDAAWRTHSCVPCSHSCEHKVAETIFKAFTRVPDGAVRRRKSQKLGENSGSETRQAMAVITLARSCPYTSMALVLSINKIGGNGFDRSR